MVVKISLLASLLRLLHFSQNFSHKSSEAGCHTKLNGHPHTQSGKQFDGEFSRGCCRLPSDQMAPKMTQGCNSDFQELTLSNNYQVRSGRDIGDGREESGASWGPTSDLQATKESKIPRVWRAGRRDAKPDSAIASAVRP